jgi:anti-sigma factor ChrR (cupin superfamily)
MKKTRNDGLPPSDRTDPASPGLERDMLDALLLGGAAVAPPSDRAEAVKEHILERVRGTARMLDNTQTIYSNAGQWIPVAPGVNAKMLYRDDSGYSFLLRLDPGATLPAHPHDGDEECIVVDGEARIGDLNILQGDYHLARRGSRHGDMFSPGGALLFIRRQGKPPERART